MTRKYTAREINAMRRAIRADIGYRRHETGDWDLVTHRRLLEYIAGGVAPDELAKIEDAKS